MWAAVTFNTPLLGCDTSSVSEHYIQEAERRIETELFCILYLLIKSLEYERQGNCSKKYVGTIATRQIGTCNSDIRENQIWKQLLMPPST